MNPHERIKKELEKDAYEQERRMIKARRVIRDMHAARAETRRINRNKRRKAKKAQGVAKRLR